MRGYAMAETLTAKQIEQVEEIVRRHDLATREEVRQCVAQGVEDGLRRVLGQLGIAMDENDARHNERMTPGEVRQGVRWAVSRRAVESSIGAKLLAGTIVAMTLGVGGLLWEAFRGLMRNG